MRHSIIRAAVAFSLLALSACSRTPAAAPAPVVIPAPPALATGDAVLAAMRERYDGMWYSTLTFTQKTSRLTADGKWGVQTWLEAMKIPGKLRIDFEPLSGGNGVLYIRDSAFTVTNGRALRGQPAVNPLLLLGFDVYANPVARTAALLRKERFDLSKTHMASFEGRPMYVVGTSTPGDLRRKQFWVDAEHLYFVRMLEPTARDSTKMQDVRFLNYERRGTAWIAPRVEIHNDGKLVFIEEYSNVKTDVSLNDAIFDPSKWRTVKHWSVP